MKVVQLRKSACKIHVHYFALRYLFTKGALPSYSSWLLLFMGEHSESRAFASSTKELAPQKRNLFTFRKSLDLFIFSLPAFHTVKEWRILVQKLDFHDYYNFEFWRKKSRFWFIIATQQFIGFWDFWCENSNISCLKIRFW